MRINEIEQKIIIYGENHTKRDEVNRIRKAIVEFKPDVILHELYWEEEEYFSKHLPNTLLLPLENEVVSDNNSMEEKFSEREQSMLENLEEVTDKYNRIAVVVGDTHLRTVETKELGKVSPINYWASLNDAKIIRSSYPEIK